MEWWNYFLNIFNPSNPRGISKVLLHKTMGSSIAVIKWKWRQCFIQFINIYTI